MKTSLFSMISGALLLGAFAFSAEEASACSRVVYHGNDNLVMVGRSLDWKNPIPTNIYVYPRGMTKKSHDLPGAITWVSKYAAVYAVGYDGGVTEGMNEKGLAVNGLFCVGTVYDNPSTMDRPPMSLAMFVAWLLDLNATTAEVVDVVRQHNFNISGATFDGGTVSALHWGVTDAQGNSAVFEFVNGDINIYEGQNLDVLTNDPTFPSMQAINAYWEKKGGTHTLPGTVSSPDRFVRGEFFINHVDTVGDADLAASIVRSVVMNMSVPYTYQVDGVAHNTTQWRSLSNLRDLRYYFDLVTNPGLYYIDLKELLLTPGAPVLKLDTKEANNLVGNANHALKRTQPFKPMY